MEKTANGAEVRRGWVDHIPLVWAGPPNPANPARLALWIGGLGGRKEELLFHLRRLASMGFHAVSFDLWQHGERGMEDRAQIMRRVFGNFYRHMRPIPARSTEDALRVTLHRGVGHRFTHDMRENCFDWFVRHTR